MAYFAELNNSLFKVIEKMYSSQDLLKLLYYDDSDPLSGSTITNPNTLLNSNIYPYYKVPDTVEEGKNMLAIFFYNGKTGRVNKGSKIEHLAIDIICHTSTSLIDQGNRYYAIAEEIDKLFNNEYIKEISMGSIYFVEFQSMKYNDDFCGIRLIYQITNISNTTC